MRNEECDDKGEPSENYGGEWVECSKCHACTNIRFPLKEPVKPLLAEQWNRRAAPVSAQTPLGIDAPEDLTVTGMDPRPAQTPAGEALREAIEWAETVLCALQPTEQVRMRVLIAAALASQSSARPQEGADTAEDFCGVPHDYSHRETRAGTAYRIAAWTCPTCAKRCSCMVLDGEHCHGDSLCIRFVDGVRTVHCGACWIADSPSPAAKVADALAELVACLAEQAAIPYGRTPDEAERAFNRRRANERRTERALTGGREALAAYLARPSCTYPACRCEGPGPDGGCGSAAIPSPDGAAG